MSDRKDRVRVLEQIRRMTEELNTTQRERDVAIIERDKARMEAGESGANAARLRHERDKYLEALGALRSALRALCSHDLAADRRECLPPCLELLNACALAGLDPDTLEEVEEC